MDLASYNNYRQLLLSFTKLKTLSQYQTFLRKLEDIKQTNSIDLYKNKFEEEGLKTSLLEIAFQTLSYHALMDFIHINLDNEKERTKLKEISLEEEKNETQFEIEELDEQSDKILLYFAAKNNPDKKASQLIGDIDPNKVTTNYTELEYREVRKCFKDIYDAILSPNTTELEYYFSLREKIKNLNLTKKELEKPQSDKIIFRQKNEHSKNSFLELALEYLDIPCFKALIYSAYDAKEIDKQIEQKKHYLQEELLKATTEQNSEDRIKNIINLIYSGADVNVQNEDGNTALHLAVYKENKEIIKILIDYGANVNAQNKDGDTALHLAVYKENKEIITKLIDSGADPSLENTHNQNPICYAAINNYKPIAAIINNALYDRNQREQNKQSNYPSR
ncbi:MAG: ankyrin repeat domain-containing protein [Rickettsiales bacterium]|nr:ankyrin repeat domain-containing protein [Rickettsiales bacterium]